MAKNQLLKILFIQSLDELSKNVSEDPLKAFKQLLIILRHEWKSNLRRVGGSTYQVPVEVSEDRGVSHAMNWIIQVF